MTATRTCGPDRSTHEGGHTVDEPHMLSVNPGLSRLMRFRARDGRIDLPKLDTAVGPSLWVLGWHLDGEVSR
jgi:hypothetical protein